MTSKTIVQDLLDNYISSIDFTELNSVSKEDLLKLQHDLEVLEIIKANKDIIFSKNPNYEDMNADDFFKLKEWLDK